MRLTIRPLLVFLALLFFSSTALACSCAFGGGMVCQDYWEAKAVFVGTVIDSKTVNRNDGGYEHHMRQVRFSIDEGFRGAEGAQIEVLTGFGGGDCGFGFSQSKQYLVYAYEYQEGVLSTGICTRTKAIEKAGEDLAYIRGLPKAKPGSKIRVSVVSHSRDAESRSIETPQANQTVVIHSENHKKEYKTDAKGLVVVDGLSPGNYEVTLSLPDGVMTPEPSRKIEVADRGCSYVYYYVVSDGRLSGRVLSAAGLPVANAQLHLNDALKPKYQGYGDSAYSDEKGNYSFRRIPPGKYVLAIRYDGKTGQHGPFPLMYFPGTADKADAQVFTFGEGQAIEQFDLLMPPLPQEYEIEGTVEALNGQPPAVEYMNSGEYVVYRAPIVDGKFRFKTYEGLRIVIRATQRIGENKWGSSKPVEVTVVAGLPPVKLVITPQP